ncbi:MAG TPA: DUF5590 domain-containing protein [Bacillaceae bacterium]|nr:DUF5590 domain-containing protein [Paenibacillus bovis]HLU23731.1 DUF5590 domain-containing protein [Bacillaceae bacterium]
MKKWILIIAVLLLLAAGGIYWLYTSTRAPLEAAKEYAEEIASSEAGIVSIEEFYMYNGSETYYVIIGKQEDEQEMVVWIPEDEEKKLIKKKLADGVSKQEVVNKLLAEENPQEILNVTLGMENDLPIWEVSYINNDSKLNYYYIHFDSGKWWRKIENL